MKIQGIKMKSWKTIIVNILITAFFSMFAYVGLLSILNNGVELGEPMWKGFIIQVLFHSQFSLAVFTVVILPIYILLKKTIDNKVTIMALLSLSVFLSLIVLQYLYQGEFWLGSLVPSILGTIMFITIEYLTSTSSRSLRSLGRS